MREDAQTEDDVKLICESTCAEIAVDVADSMEVLRRSLRLGDAQHVCREVKQRQLIRVRQELT